MLSAYPEFIDVMKSSWRSGDIETLTTNSLVVQMKSDFPELYNTLVISRNNDWMLTLSTLNNNNVKEFVLVGALHLNDKEGLLNQLSKAGFKIEQL